jgi:hypothetical protein
MKRGVAYMYMNQTLSEQFDLSFVLAILISVYSQKFKVFIADCGHDDYLLSKVERYLL